MHLISVLVCLVISTGALCQDSTFLKVHFLYGSRPLKKYRDSEQKWFGGIKGGHVGIEGSNGNIVNFLPSGKFHWFEKNKKRHSRYAVHSLTSFYGMFGTEPDSVKKAIVYIPVTREQMAQFDSITKTYLNQTPYDYALFGMRCAAASYEILGQLRLMPRYGHRRTFMKIFYPQKFRKRLFRKASQKGWTIVRIEGNTKRKWEKR